MVVTLKIAVLWGVMLCVTLMLETAGEHVALKHWCQAISLQSLYFYILCNILASDFIPSISNAMSLWNWRGREGE